MVESGIEFVSFSSLFTEHLRKHVFSEAFWLMASCATRHFPLARASPEWGHAKH